MKALDTKRFSFGSVSGISKRKISVAPPTPACRVMGPCFACGEMGHMHASCPRTFAAPDRSR